VRFTLDAERIVAESAGGIAIDVPGAGRIDLRRGRTHIDRRDDGWYPRDRTAARR
jgi:hypothetical protein